MVIVRKPSGSVRIYCNLTEVNKVVIKDHFFLPTLGDLGHMLSGSKFFSKLDMRGAYLQVSLHPEVR